MSIRNRSDRIGTIVTPCGVAYAVRCRYSDDAFGVQLIGIDGQPLGMLSVNLTESTDQLGDGEFFAKTYSENQALAGPALASGLFEDTGRTGRAGYLTFPIWRRRDSAAASAVAVEVAHG